MTPEEIDIARFDWNAKISAEDVENMKALRLAARDLAALIYKIVPACADRSAALRDLRVAVMQANLAIAHRDLHDK